MDATYNDAVIPDTSGQVNPDRLFRLPVQTPWTRDVRALERRSGPETESYMIGFHVQFAPTDRLGSADRIGLPLASFRPPPTFQHADPIDRSACSGRLGASEVSLVAGYPAVYRRVKSNTITPRYMPAEPFEAQQVRLHLGTFGAAVSRGSASIKGDRAREDEVRSLSKAGSTSSKVVVNDTSQVQEDEGCEVGEPDVRVGGQTSVIRSLPIESETAVAELAAALSRLAHLADTLGDGDFRVLLRKRANAEARCIQLNTDYCEARFYNYHGDLISGIQLDLVKARYSLKNLNIAVNSTLQGKSASNQSSI